MSRKFKIAFWSIVAAQLVLLLVIVGIKEYTLRSGTEVVLQTVPVDPRSIFQGDYVILAYEIGTPPPTGVLPAYLDLEAQPFGTEVYVTLEQSGDLWIANGYDFFRPSNAQVVIKGSVIDRGRLDFGIGTYFVPEGTGRGIEGASDVKVRLVVSGNGNAVIKEVLVDGKPFDPDLATPTPPPPREILPEPARPQ